MLENIILITNAYFTFTVTGADAIPLTTTSISVRPVSVLPETSKVVDATPV